MIIMPYLKERLLCKNSKYLFCWDKGQIILRNSINKQYIQGERIHTVVKSVSLIERLLRLEPRAAISLSSESFIYSCHGYIYRYLVKENTSIVEHKFVDGMNNPLTFCTRYNESGDLIEVLYGEYMQNEKRMPVSIYRRTNGKWDKIFSFSSHTILHIHNIIYDKYQKRYIITTGDRDSESGIWEADLDFKSVKPIIKGLQRYRSCIVHPTADSIYYVTDTPLEGNWIYKLQEKGDRVYFLKIAPIPGPCIFGKILNNDLYISTSVEGDPEIGKWRYMLSNKLGKGVKDNYSHVIRLKNEQIEEITKFKKDLLPMGLFQFGNVRFPISDDNKVYLCPQSTFSKHGTYVINEK